MKILSIRTNLSFEGADILPLIVYTVGTERQSPMTRIEGFSGMQLILTFSGRGKFRLLGQEKWDIVPAQSVLYIPEGLPHEYLSAGDTPWMVGFVSFKGMPHAGEVWGMADAPFLRHVGEIGRLSALLERIWSYSGADHDVWAAAEHLYAFLTEMKKQTFASEQSSRQASLSPLPYRDAIVLRTTKFMREHMPRDLTMADLSAQIGYSHKHLTRLFQQAVGTTPLQYLKRIRLQTAARLLEERRDLTVGEVANTVGMEPVYFTRMFRREFGVVPTVYRNMHRGGAE
jgi:AraC-like DNA-binding protein